MARRLQTVLYDLDPSPLVERLFTGFAIDDGVDREPIYTPVKLSEQMVRAHRYTLRPLQGGGYTPSVPVTVTQAARGGSLLKEWGGIELFYSAPTSTTVEARLHDGAGSSLYWDGADWVAAGASDWNTPAEVVANFATLTASDATLVGVQWRLTTTDRTATPYVYGAAIAARLMFAARSGSTASETRSDGWTDDLIHRVLIPWFRANVVPEVTDEKELVDEVLVLDYAEGINWGEGNYVVSGVQAVHDLDADPAMDTPLSGSWDSSDSTYTLASPIDAHTRFAARLTYEPIVAYTGRLDYFDAALPQVLLEEVVTIDDTGGAGTVVVRDTANLTAIRVPASRKKRSRVTVLLQADGQVTAMELAESIERAFNGKRGVVVVSGGTGMPVNIHGMTTLRPARGNQTVAGAARFDLELWTREYHGTEESSAPLLKSGGFVTTVAPRETVVAR